MANTANKAVPARKSTPRKTAQPVPPVPPVSSNEPVIGVLCGQEIEILPVQQWRSSAMKALKEGDLDLWAERCLSDDGLDVWEELDPTFAEIGEFFASFSDEMAAAESQQPQSNRATRRAGARGRR